MARPPFDPEQATPQQKMALHVLDAARDSFDRAKENLKKAIDGARDAAVPLPVIEQRAGVGKSTIHRWETAASGSADGANPGQE